MRCRRVAGVAEVLGALLAASGAAGCVSAAATARGDGRPAALDVCVLSADGAPVQTSPDLAPAPLPAHRPADPIGDAAWPWARPPLRIGGVREIPWPGPSTPPPGPAGPWALVVDAAHCPVADAWVAVAPAGTLDYRHFRTDAEGLFPLGGLPAEGLLVVQLIQRGHATARFTATRAALIAGAAGEDRGGDAPEW